MSVEMIIALVCGAAVSALGYFLSREIARGDELRAQVNALTVELNAVADKAADGSKLRDKVEALERSRAVSQALTATIPTLDNFKDLLKEQLEPLQKSITAFQTELRDLDRRVFQLELKPGEKADP